MIKPDVTAFFDETTNSISYVVADPIMSVFAEGQVDTRYMGVLDVPAVMQWAKEHLPDITL